MSYNDLKEIRHHGDEMMPICFYEINPQSGLRCMNCHWHKEWELFKVQSGRMKIQYGESFVFAEEGAVFFFNGGEIHAAEPVGDDPIVYRAVVFNPDILCGNDVVQSKYISQIITGRMKLPTIINFDPRVTADFDELSAALMNKDFGYELLVKSLLYKIFAGIVKYSKLAELPPLESSMASSIKRAIRHIHENYGRPITIDELSTLCNMSEGHFCRLFKQYTLKTPVQYINNVRISKAIELLISGNSKILDIAMDTGFNGLSYFIGVFKESVGVTPSKFRREYGINENLGRIV